MSIYIKNIRKRYYLKYLYRCHYGTIIKIKEGNAVKKKHKTETLCNINFRDTVFGYDRRDSH